MKTISIWCCIISTMLLSGCYGIHFHNRSVVNYYDQKAETYGTINNTPHSGPQQVAAEKTFDTAAAVNTSGGTATATPQKQPNENIKDSNE